MRNGEVSDETCQLLQCFEELKELRQRKTRNFFKKNIKINFTQSKRT